MNKKLNVLLAVTDHLASVWKNMLSSYVVYFKKNQGDFKGLQKTYEPRQGTIDYPTERANELVVTTVDEKLSYLEKNSKEYIDALFSQEKTNASGLSKAKLIVDGIDFGEFTSMELLRLKSLLENGNLKEMYEELPTRNDNELWAKSTAEMYSGRNIFQTELRKGVTKSNMKESYILTDPNITKGEPNDNYKPQIAQRDNVIELGDYTLQRFSGETSHVERAAILQRRSKMVSACIEALKIANKVEAIQSDMTAEKLFNYLHRGK